MNRIMVTRWRWTLIALVNACLWAILAPVWSEGRAEAERQVVAFAVWVEAPTVVNGARIVVQHGKPKSFDQYDGLHRYFRVLASVDIYGLDSNSKKLAIGGGFSPKIFLTVAYTEYDIRAVGGVDNLKVLFWMPVTGGGAWVDAEELEAEGTLSRGALLFQGLKEARWRLIGLPKRFEERFDDISTPRARGGSLLLDEVGLPSFSTNEAFSCGIIQRQHEQIILTPEERRQAMDTLVALEERYEGRISATAGPLALAHDFARIDEALARGETGFPGRGTLSACGGSFTKLDVLHDGTIVPCLNLSSLHLGVIGQDNLQQIWLEHPLMLRMRQRHNVPLRSLDTCRDCPYAGFCTGGCPAGALFSSGELDGRNPMDCYRVHRGEDPFYVL